MSQPARGNEATSTNAHNRELRRGAIGVTGILFFVLSAQAPLTGIAGALPLAVSMGNGAGVPAAYLVVGAIIAVFAVGYIAMSRHLTAGGAFHTYIGRALGPGLGTGSALLALWAYNTTQACMYGLYGATTSALAETYLHLTAPWWAWSAATMLLVQLLGSLDIDLGARFLAVLVAAEMAILLAFALATLITGGGPEGLAPAASFSPAALLSGAPGVALTFAIASMFGFESTAIYAAEAKDPARTVPRATYLAVGIIALFFAFVSWMVVSSHGPSHVAERAGRALHSGDSTALVFSAVSHTLGAWAGTTAGALMATSLLAGILAFHNASNRYLHSLGRAAAMPPLLARTTRRGAPFVASGLQTALALVLVLPFAALDLDPVLTLFSWGSGVAILGLLVLYFLTSVSVVVFFQRTRLETRPWHTRIAPALAAVLIAGLATLVLTNFDLLTGGAPSTATPLVLTVPAVLLTRTTLGSRRGNDQTATPTAPSTTTGADPHLPDA